MTATEIEALAETVRKASRAGELVALDEACPQAENASQTWTVAANAEDIVPIREGGRTYLFSERHMSRSYAEAAALGASGNAVRMIAATVRSDSATYPRPTPLEAFYGRPFFLSADEVAGALARMRGDGRHSDIDSVRASNGAEYLFSRDHMTRDQADAVAERLAVGRFDNP
jgi:hypothetical protein